MGNLATSQGGSGIIAAPPTPTEEVSDRDVRDTVFDLP